MYRISLLNMPLCTHRNHWYPHIAIKSYCSHKCLYVTYMECKYVQSLTSPKYPPDPSKFTTLHKSSDSISTNPRLMKYISSPRSPAW